METKLFLESFGQGRKKVCVSIELSPDETEALAKKICPRHTDSKLPVPCLFYLTPDPAVKVAKGSPTWEGTAYKAYFLQAARMVPLNRSLPGKTLVRFPFPGTIDFGHVNAGDEQRLLRWWQETKKTIAEDLREKIFSVGPAREQFTSSGEKTVDAASVTLNPLNPNEKAGVRKRSLDDF
jgi:hypothetical protein